MSLGLVALLLIRLDANPGEWHTVGELATAFSVTEQKVAEHLQFMREHEADADLVLKLDPDGRVIAACIESNTSALLDGRSR